MKINRSNHKPIKTLVTVVVLLSFFSVGAILASDMLGYSSIILNKGANTSNESDNTNTVDYNPPTEEQKQSGEDIKSQSDQPATNNDLGISITSVSLDGETVKIRNAISGAVTNSGTCSIKIINSANNQIYETTAATFAMTSYSTCQGFNIAKSELGAGEWQIELSVTANNKTSTATEVYTVE